MTQKVFVCLAALGAFLVLAAPAVAGIGAAGGQYLGVGGKTQTTVTPAKSQTETLPFTGFNLLYLVGGSVVLLGTGLVLRRRNRRAETEKASR